MTLAVGGSGTALQIGYVDKKLVSVDIDRKPPVSHFKTVTCWLMFQWLELCTVGVSMKCL
jgi:hypothetical protein